jgi:hypothetical protein
MLKNKILVGSALAAIFLGSNIAPVSALELDEDTRTVTLDGKGNSVVLTPEQENVESVYLTTHVVLVT